MRTRLKTKEALQKIIEEENIDYIDLQETCIMVYLGDIENTTTETGFKYFLLDTYLQIPYDFDPLYCQLHRGIINEYETGGENLKYKYSGFVHYSGNSFCYGQAQCNVLLSALQDDELTADNFLQMLSYFIRYLSVSSHESMTNSGIFYKKLDVEYTVKVDSYATKFKHIEGMQVPFEITNVITNDNCESIDYSKPYTEVIKEDSHKTFLYKGELITPKIVRHHTKKTTTKSIEREYVNIDLFLDNIKNYKIQRIKDEINSKKRNLVKDMLYKFANSQQRVDGSVYL